MVKASQVITKVVQFFNKICSSQLKQAKASQIHLNTENVYINSLVLEISNISHTLVLIGLSYRILLIN